MKVAAKSTKTAGTVIGDRLRARSNDLSDERRQELRTKAMQVIYGGPSGAHSLTGRR